MPRNRPRDLSTAFEWPPSPDDLAKVSVVRVGAPFAAFPVRSASPAVAAAAAPMPSGACRSRHRLDTLQQLTLLAAGMLVGAALPGSDDGRRPIIGIAQVAEAASPAKTFGSPALFPSIVTTQTETPLASVPAAVGWVTAAPSVATGRSAAPRVVRRAATSLVRRDPRTLEVLQVLRQYEKAFSRMDAGATSAVWPSANHADLTRSFTAVREQRLWLHGCTVTGTGPEAAGTCRGTLRYRPRVGDHSTKLRRGTWRFALEQADEGWLISQVNIS